MKFKSIKLIWVTLLMMLTISAFSQKKKVYLVGGGALDAIQEQDIMLSDSISQWVDVIYVYQNDFNADASETKYDTVDGVIFLESCDSKAITGFGTTEEFPVPCITMEAGVVLSDNNRWNLIVPDVGGIWGYGGVDCEDIDLEWEVADPEHLIMKNAGDYKVGDNIVWSNYPEPTDYGIPYPHDIDADINIIAVAARDYPGSNEANKDFNQDDALGIFEIPEKSLLYMCAAATYLLPENGTQEFFNILHEAVLYMFDPRPVTVKAMEKNSLVNIFPNPAKEIINITLQNAQNDKLVISNLRGQKVMETILNLNKVSLNIKDLDAGLYFITIRNQTSKLVVE